MRRKRGPRPILWLVFACFGLLVGGISTFYEWGRLKMYPNQPEPIPLPQAVEWLSSPSPTGWVTLTGGRWQCAGLQVYQAGKTNDTDIVYKGDGPVAVLATFEGTLNCGDFNNKPATGVLQVMNDQGQATARQNNPFLASLPDDTQVIALCGYCGPSNDRIGLLLCASLFVGGLFFLFVAGLEMKKLHSGH